MIFTSDAVWEFFSPFAHIPGTYEWCRIHSPTHGSFDTFIILKASTAHPPVVYVNSEEGLNFMRDRYPESTCIQVPASKLVLKTEQEGATVTGSLNAGEGPVRRVRMRLSASLEMVPEAVPYGGKGFPVWGGRWQCEGVDLNRAGICSGKIVHENGRTENLRDVPCIVTAGSIACITPL